MSKQGYFNLMAVVAFGACFIMGGALYDAHHTINQQSQKIEQLEISAKGREALTVENFRKIVANVNGLMFDVRSAIEFLAPKGETTPEAVYEYINLRKAERNEEIKARAEAEKAEEIRRRVEEEMRKDSLAGAPD